MYFFLWLYIENILNDMVLWQIWDLWTFIKVMLTPSVGPNKTYFRFSTHDTLYLHNTSQFISFNLLTIFSLFCFFHLGLTWSFFSDRPFQSKSLDLLHTCKKVQKSPVNFYRVNTSMDSIPRSTKRMLSEPQKSYPILFPAKSWQ